MASEWQKITLGELLDNWGGEIKTGPFGTKLKASEYSEEGVPVISVGEVQLGRLVLHNRTPKVPPSVTDRMPEYLLNAGDIVFGRKGAVERSARVAPEQEGWFLGSDFIRLRLPDTCDSGFVSYQFLSQAHKQWMIQHAAGTTMASLNEKIIRLIPISLPPIHVQKNIAHVLGTLDDRIELNRRMNETLEGMAQALFKSWFVDFDPVVDNALASGKEIPGELSVKAQARAALGDKRKPLPEAIRSLFPDEFTYSDELGWIPVGWKVGAVGDILERLTIRKRYKKKDVTDYGLTPVYEQGASLLLGYHNGEAEIEASVESPAFIFGDHTCVTKLSCEPFSISENVIPLRGNKYPTLWTYYAIQGKQSFEEYRRH
jgi:type I restriction enzyme S subunit